MTARLADDRRAQAAEAPPRAGARIAARDAKVAP